MGTRSNIGVTNDDGTVTSIYCHWDGYPSHHVPILTHSYGTAEKARALVAPGDLSSLGNSIGEKHDFDRCPRDVCNYYGRDRGESGTEPLAHASRSAFEQAADEAYAYLFADGKWLCRGKDGWWPAEGMGSQASGMSKVPSGALVTAKWKQIERTETNEFVLGVGEKGKAYFCLIYRVIEGCGGEIRERRERGAMLHSATAWKQLGADFPEAALAFKVAAPAIEALRGACRQIEKKRKR